MAGCTRVGGELQTAYAQFLHYLRGRVNDRPDQVEATDQSETCRLQYVEKHVTVTFLLPFDRSIRGQAILEEVID